MKINYSLLLVMTCLLVISPLAKAGAELCGISGVPTVSDMDDDNQNFLAVSPIFPRGSAIINARTGTNPITGLPDVTFWFPLPYNTNAWRADVVALPDTASIRWSKRCVFP